jgi:xylulokinase
MPAAREAVAGMTTLVAGVDSSTQSCKVVIRDVESGVAVRSGSAPHPGGTEVSPAAWWDALQTAVAAAGGLDDVAAVSVGAQQHGMVCLDGNGDVVRPALLWNDTRSAAAADDLVAEAGGPDAWAAAVGSVPLASFTITKLRWLAEHEPESLRRTEAVCLPHDWLTWRLGGGMSFSSLVTDRSDASGTGYWSPATNAYRTDLLRTATGRDLVLPTVLSASASAGRMAGGQILGSGAGDNAAAALGLSVAPGDVVVSLGTSGTAFRRWTAPTGDATGIVAGFADAQDGFLPLVCTLNAARVLDAAAAMLGVSHGALSDLALSAPAGAGGLVLVPYLEGERTPNKPDSTGALHGLTLATSTPAMLARAAVEGMLCALADAVDALVVSTSAPTRVILIGGAAASPAVRAIAPAIFGLPVVVPASSEYVADGAARQAAWVLAGSPTPPDWPLADAVTVDGAPTPHVRARYADARDLTISREGAPAPVRTFRNRDHQRRNARYIGANQSGNRQLTAPRRIVRRFSDFPVNAGRRHPIQRIRAYELGGCHVADAQRRSRPQPADVDGPGHRRTEHARPERRGLVRRLPGTMGPLGAGHRLHADGMGAFGDGDARCRRRVVGRPAAGAIRAHRPRRRLTPASNARRCRDTRLQR